MKDTYSYHVTTGPVREMVVHARRKRRDHAEAVARKMSTKYADETFRVWQETERDSPIGRIRSSQAVIAYLNGEAVER